MSGTNNTLPDLIMSRQEGRSLQEFSDDCGGSPSKSRLWQLLNREMKTWPEPEVVRGLARGLRVSEASVIQAAATSLGFEMWETSRLSSLLPDAADDLDDAQVSAVLAVVSAMNPSSAP